MSDGAFRDDQEAALARAAALEDELARQKAENEKLRAEAKAEHDRADRAEKVAKKQPKEKPAPPPTALRVDAPRKSFFARYGMGIVVVVGSVAFAFGLVWLQVRKQTSRSDSRLERSRWKALVAISNELRSDLQPDSLATQTAAAVDPRNTDRKTFQTPVIPSATMSSSSEVALFMDMPGFQPAVSIMTRWQTASAAYTRAITALEAYYRHKDWQDDNYASAEAKWKAAQDASREVHAATEVLRDRLLPLVYAEMRRYEREYESASGRNDNWWYLELGIQLQMAHDDKLWGDSAKADQELAAIDEAVKTAPLEVRRTWRGRSYKLTSGSFRNELFRALVDAPVP